MMHLDNMSVGGSVEDVIHDLDVIKAAEDLGLLLNNSNPKIICHDNAARGMIIIALPGAIVVDPERLACWDCLWGMWLQLMLAWISRFRP